MKNSKIEELKKNKNKMIIELLEEVIEKLKNDDFENKGISVTQFHQKYKDVSINSNKALQWLDKYEYTTIDGNKQRIVTKKGENHLNQGLDIIIKFTSGDIYIKKYPLIPLEQEKFFIKIFNKDNFS